MKKKSLQNEKDTLQRHVAELETRYAEKARYKHQNQCIPFLVT